MRWWLVLPLGVVLPAAQAFVEQLRSGGDGLAARVPFLAAVGLGSVAGVAVALRWVFRGRDRLHTAVTAMGLLAAMPVSLVALTVVPWVLPQPVSGFLASFLPLVLCTFAAWDWYRSGA